MSGELGAHHHSAHAASTDDTKSETSLAEPSNPDVFSLVAQENLLDALNPAFCHVVKVLASSYPTELGFAYKYRQELFLCMNAFLEAYTLYKHSASFSENFYSLKRIPDGGNWTSYSRAVNLAVLIVLPYVKRKLEETYQHLMELSVTSTRQKTNSWMEVACDIFRVVYPYFRSVWSTLRLMYLIRYMYKKGNVYSPLISLCGVRLSYKDPDDTPTATESIYSSISEVLFDQNRSVYKRIRDSIATSLTHLPDTIFPLFSASIFFLQFLQWYSSYEQTQLQSDSQRSTAQSVPPPKINERLREQLDATICPICLKTRTNSTALSTSGIVYCYPCIYNYVKQHSICPVTRRQASLNNLIKLYITQ